MEAMDLPLCMCPRLTMAMARGTLRLSLDMAMPLATPTGLPRDFMVTMAAIMARGMLRLSPDMDMAMLEATPTGLPRDFMDTMVVTDMVATMARGLLRPSLDMALALFPTIPMAATDMARGLLSLDMAMAVATPLFTRAALTTTDPTATTSTTLMARGLLSLAMDMDMGITEELPATSMSPAPTLIMELISPMPTENRAH